jgi:hypothetical protein
MLRYQAIAYNTARVRALTTLEPDEFADLVPVFETCFMERVRDYTIDGLPRLNRRVTVQGGPKITERTGKPTAVPS